MWQFIGKKTTNGMHYQLFNDSQAVTFKQVLTLFQDSTDFREFYISQLKQLPFMAYKWETPAISKLLIQRDFEFVAIDAPELERKQNASAFSDYFKLESKVNNATVWFENLSGDARLLVPTPLESHINYCHIGSFTQSASPGQQHDLWQTVGKLALELASDQPLWISTAGEGVPWLHIRFDLQPKYYAHQSFKLT